MAFSRYSFFLLLCLGLLSCQKETQNQVVRYEISSSSTNRFLVTYLSDLDAERGTQSTITVEGGYWTVNHIGVKLEPYYIKISHDTSSKPPFAFELYVIANEDTVDHRTDTTMFRDLIVKGRKL